MQLASVLWLAFGLSMDATAVSAARGLAAPRLRPRHYALVAGLFGGAHALVPLLGWAFGAWIGPAVRAWGGWIAFALLTLLGGKMLWEARAAHGDDDEAPEQAPREPFAPRTMLALALATSVDTFAAGVTLPLLRAPFAFSIAAIGLVTAAMSALGLAAGRRFGASLGRRLDALGGLVLLALGAKALVEHLRA